MNIVNVEFKIQNIELTKEICLHWIVFVFITQWSFLCNEFLFHDNEHLYLTDNIDNMRIFRNKNNMQTFGKQNVCDQLLIKQNSIISSSVLDCKSLFIDITLQSIFVRDNKAGQ